MTIGRDDDQLALGSTARRWGDAAVAKRARRAGVDATLAAGDAAPGGSPRPHRQDGGRAVTVNDVTSEVVAAALEMERAGLVVGTAGNVSARRPDGTIALTPSSTPYGDITPEGLAVVDLDGNVREGGRPSTEKAMHLACYRTFPEVGGVVHCHPLHASMFAVARQAIPAVIEEVIVYVGGDIPIAEYRTTGSDDLAVEVVKHLADRGAVLMANHGLLCVGRSAADALHTALVVEHTAHIVWGAAALGGVVALPEKVVGDFGGIYGYVRRETWTPDGLSEG